MNRRGFLIGLGTSLIAAPAVVRANSLMPLRDLAPLVMGDGIYDDAAGLNAFISGQRVRIASAVRANFWRQEGKQGIVGGQYYATESIHFPSDCPTSLKKLAINFGGYGVTPPSLIFHQPADLYVPMETAENTWSFRETK